MPLPRTIHLAVLKDLRRQCTDAAKEFEFLIPYLRNRRRDKEADELVKLWYATMPKHSLTRPRSLSPPDQTHEPTDRPPLNLTPPSLRRFQNP
jgi:hypothetical protein